MFRPNAILMLTSLAVAVPATANAEDAITPQDGTWQSKNRKSAFSDCGAMIQNMFQKMLDKSPEEKPRKIDWGGSFDPAKMGTFNNAPGQEITWRKTGPNSYSGKMVQKSTDGKPMAQADMTMTLTAPGSIKGTTAVSMAQIVPGGAAAMAQMGSGNCAITTSYDIVRVGE